MCKVWIKAFEYKRSEFGIRALLKEPSDFHFLENIIPSQYLIGSLTCQHNLVSAILHELRKHKEGCRCGPNQRLLGMPDYIREYRADIGICASDFAVISVKVIYHLLLV